MTNKLEELNKALLQKQSDIDELLKEKERLEKFYNDKRIKFENAIHDVIKELFDIEISYIIDCGTFKNEVYFGIHLKDNHDYQTIRRALYSHEYDDDGTYIHTGVAYEWDTLPYQSKESDDNEN